MDKRTSAPSSITCKFNAIFEKKNKIGMRYVGTQVSSLGKKMRKDPRKLQRERAIRKA